jgi:predicted amidohydrolase
MPKLRVAGAQLPVTKEISTNVAALERALEFARQQDAAILLTPEGSLSGYTPRFNAAEATQALAHITGLARAAGVGLALGTCFVEPDGGRCYNQLRFYNREGAYLGFHSKILRCGTLEEEPQGEINDYAATPLRTFDFHGLTVGGLICNDLWANPGCTPQADPHLTQQLARMGAQVIFHAVNGGRNGSEWSRVNWCYHESNLRMRAQAARIPIVTVDNCHPTQWPCSAPSGVIGADGNWLVQTDESGEQFFAWTLELF